MSPPAPAITATAIAARREKRRSIRCPTANEHWSIAQLAPANANTAAVVCVKSCHVKSGPYGTGHPLEHGTCDASRKSAHDARRVTVGGHARSTGGRERMSRAAIAMSVPPATRVTSATSNAAAVGSPSAPSSLT